MLKTTIKKMNIGSLFYTKFKVKMCVAFQFCVYLGDTHDTVKKASLKKSLCVSSTVRCVQKPNTKNDTK
mgnify:CR=1 FL=1